MKKVLTYSAWAAFSAVVVLLAASPLAGQTAAGGKLAMSGDITYFLGQGIPLNCTLNNRFKRGEPVGFRVTAFDPVTGQRDRKAELVVHVTYGGKTVDIPMRDRQNEKQPEREFWVAKWIVPADAPVGIVRYSVTAKDSQGRTSEWKPFPVENSMLTVVE